MNNYKDTIIPQYATSPVLNRIIDNINAYLDQSANIDLFFSTIWNVETAQGFGLDIWGRIVGVVRVITVASSDYFGFEGPGGQASGNPFNQSPFYSGVVSTSNFALTDDAFRTLIYAKALSNISDGSIPGVNQILLLLFPGRGNCYVQDNQDMSITYVFTFPLTPVELSIVYNSGVLPKPSNVSSSVSIP